MKVRTSEHSIGTLNPIRTHQGTQKKPSKTQHLRESWKQDIRALNRNLKPYQSIKRKPTKNQNLNESWKQEHQSTQKEP